MGACLHISHLTPRKAIREKKLLVSWLKIVSPWLLSYLTLSFAPVEDGLREGVFKLK